jgi:hypothetical protein
VLVGSSCRFATTGTDTANSAGTCATARFTGETQDLIEEGLQRGYTNAELNERLSSLARRAMIAISRLHRYLRTTKEP